MEQKVQVREASERKKKKQERLMKLTCQDGGFAQTLDIYLQDTKMQTGVHESLVILGSFSLLFELFTLLVVHNDRARTMRICESVRMS